MRAEHTIYLMEEIFSQKLFSGHFMDNPSFGLLRPFGYQTLVEWYFIKTIIWKQDLKSKINSSWIISNFVVHAIYFSLFFSFLIFQSIFINTI